MSDVWLLIIFILILIVGVILTSLFIRRNIEPPNVQDIGESMGLHISAGFNAAWLRTGSPVDDDTGECRILRWRDGNVNFNVSEIDPNLGDRITVVEDLPCLMPNEYQLQKVNISCEEVPELVAFSPNSPKFCISRDGERMDVNDESTLYISCGGADAIPRCANLFTQIRIDDHCMTASNGHITAESCEPIDQYTDRLLSQLFVVHDASVGIDDISNDNDNGVEVMRTLPPYFYLSMRPENGDSSLPFVGIDLNNDHITITGISHALVYGKSNDLRIFNRYIVSEDSEREGKQISLEIDSDRIPTALMGILGYNKTMKRPTPVISYTARHVQRHGGHFRLVHQPRERVNFDPIIVIPYDIEDIGVPQLDVS